MTRGERRRRSAVIYKKRLDEYTQTDIPWARFMKSIEPLKTYHLKDTPKICSCNACCNPRRNGWLKKKERLSKQEKFLNMKFREELKEAS